MNMSAPTFLRELDSRSGDGLDIRLLWDPADDSLAVTVADARSEEFFVIPVAAADAREAFNHPFAFAAVVPQRNRGRWGADHEHDPPHPRRRRRDGPAHRDRRTTAPSRVPSAVRRAENSRQV